MFSQSEENYIKAIYSLSSANTISVTTNLLAEKMNTKASSVTDMIKKLSDKELIHYQKYQGCELTEKGNQIALQILRKHRLWEVFLVEKLHFGWEEVHEIAEQLEHIQSRKLIDRLDELLEFPKFDPHGEPIPSAKGEIAVHPKSILLSELIEGQCGIVVGVEDGSPDFFDFLNSYKISLGVRIHVLEIFRFDQSVKVLVNDEELNVSNTVSTKILIQLNK